MQSSYFAGYSASASTWVSSFQGSLTVPKVTCPATGTYTIEPSLWASERGPAYVQVYELISCVNGRSASDQFNVVIGSFLHSVVPRSASLATVAGDQLSFKMVNKSLAGATVTLSDTTAGTSVSASQMGVGYLVSIGAGTNLNGPASPIPAFTPITFGDVTFNLSTLTAFSVTKSELYDGFVLQVSTSDISTGGTFQNDFVHT